MVEDKSSSNELTPELLAAAGAHVVYVRSEVGAQSAADSEVDLVNAWSVFWKHKWIIIGSTILCAVASILYALTLTHWYRAEVLLAPVEERRMSQGLVGQLSGLAQLAGIGSGGRSSIEALAVLQSREFTRAFIEDENLLTVLFAEQWDQENNRWRGDPEDWPDLRAAVKFFGENVRTVEQDRSTGLVKLQIEWIVPELAATWADTLARRLNEHMRSRALKEAQTNLEYLQSQLQSTSVVALQQSIGRLLEIEMQKLMLARGSEEYSFRIIDGAVIPKSPSRPRRRMIAMLATVLGGALSVFAVFIWHFVRSYPAPKSQNPQQSI